MQDSLQAAVTSGRTAEASARAAETSGRTARLSLLIGLAIGLAGCTWSASMLTWDGAFYVWQSLHRQWPEYLHNRWNNHLLLWPAALLTSITDDTWLLAQVTTAVYALVPLGTLWGCWQLRDEQRPELEVWVALGVCLAILPVQVNLNGEMPMATQLMWPLLLAPWSPHPWRRRWLSVIATLLLATTHPLRAGVMVLAAGSWALACWRGRVSQRETAIAIAGLLATAGVSAVTAVLLSSGYEQALTERLSVGFFIAEWHARSASYQLVVVLVAALIVTLAIRPLIARRTSTGEALSRVGMWAIVACLAAVLVGWWAPDSRAWWDGLHHRWQCVPLSLLCALLYLFERCRPSLDRRVVHPQALLQQVQQPGCDQQSAYRLLIVDRQRVMVVVAGLCAVVLWVQSAVWAGRVAQLRAALEGSPTSVLDMSELTMVQTAADPLCFYTLPHLAQIVQGREPAVLVIPGSLVAEALIHRRLRLVDFEDRVGGPGWFRLNSALGWDERALPMSDSQPVVEASQVPGRRRPPTVAFELGPRWMPPQIWYPGWWSQTTTQQQPSSQDPSPAADAVEPASPPSIVLHNLGEQPTAVRLSGELWLSLAPTAAEEGISVRLSLQPWTAGQQELLTQELAKLHVRPWPRQRLDGVTFILPPGRSRLTFDAATEAAAARGVVWALRDFRIAPASVELPSERGAQAP